MRPAICIDPLWPGLAAEEKIARVAQAGFAHVEFWNWRDKNIPALAEACQRNGVQVVNFSGHRAGSLVATYTHDVLLHDLESALRAARLLNCQTLMLLTNSLNPDGSAVESFDQIPDAAKRENVVAGLRKILAAAPEDFSFVLEPLNTRLDHPGYFLTDMGSAVALVKQVDSSRMKVLCDLYHLGVMGDDLPRLIAEHLPNIGHFHVADFPGRHEPGTGSADWPALLRLIRSLGYAGYVGFEYFPIGDAEASLAAVRQVWDGA